MKPGVEVAGKKFRAELAATGKMSISDVETNLIISRKTLIKHVQQGHLVGSLTRVFGKPMWLFDPQDVERYKNILPDLLREAVKNKRNRPQKYQPEDGWLRLVGRFREAFPCRFSPELEELAIINRLDYVKRKMRERRERQ